MQMRGLRPGGYGDVFNGLLTACNYGSIVVDCSFCVRKLGERFLDVLN